MNVRKLTKTFVFSLFFAIVLAFLSRLLIFSLFPLDFEDEIRKNASKYDLSEHLVCAIIKAESNFSPDADSGRAKGLMQLTDETALWVANKMGLTDFTTDKINDPKTNIELGCYYLDYLFKLHSNKETVLACYNAGPGNVSGWLSDKNYSHDGKTLFAIPFSETKDYVERVLRYENIYEKLY